MPQSCCAFGCTMRGGTNKLSQIKFFTFPVCPVRRQQWVTAVHRENWQPTKYSVLCSRHFIEGKPSKDIRHPDWIPTVFSHRATSSKHHQNRVARYDRLKARQLTLAKPEIVPEPEAMEVEYTENSSVKSQWVQTDLTGLDISEMMYMNESLKKEATAASSAASSYFPSKDIETDQTKLKFLTGLPSFTLYSALLTYILSKWNLPNVNLLTYSDQLLLTLMKLRLGLLYSDLAYRFGITKKNASLIFKRWIKILAEELRVLIIWPDKKSLQKSLPLVFKKENIRDVRCIIDCTEFFLERPNNLTRRSQTYSNYKHHNTVKVLIGITPNGSISFISDSYGGKISDKELTIKSGFLKKLNQGDLVLADRGFLIRDVLASRQVRLIVPAYTRGKNQLSRREVETSRQISRLRIHVERVIGQLKTFRILQGTLSLSLLQGNADDCLLDQILIVCSGLLNMLDPIVN